MENDKKIFRCCICGDVCEGWGNNPAGAAWKNENGEVIFPKFTTDDRCCDCCNQMYVIPGRIYRSYHPEKVNED